MLSAMTLNSVSKDNTALKVHLTCKDSRIKNNQNYLILSGFYAQEGGGASIPNNPPIVQITIGKALLDCQINL